MKKFLAILLCVAMIVCMAAGCGSSSSSTTTTDTSSTTTDTTAADTVDTGDTAADDTDAEPAAEADISVAMITDYGDITDQSFNQTTYEACVEYCNANGIDFQYYKPTGDSTAERVSSTEQAIGAGYTVIVMPGYAFAGTIEELAGDYPEITFIALDVSSSDFSEGYTLPENVYCAVYQEELAGYMAGYAAVKLGYTHLGFLGGMAVPAVVRYGYGYIQGADAAAAEFGADVTIEYCYGDTFQADADVTAVMDTWYQTLGVEVVFACGGGIYGSAAEAAAKVDAKVIGVDVDQAASIDGTYGEGMTVTSAMKGLAATVKTMLQIIVDGDFASYGGQIDTLGLVSDSDMEANYVQIPMESTQWDDNFTQDDYTALVADMYSGALTVNNDTSISAADCATVVTVNDYGSIKN
ncbi:MAG: BMP family ABC transporter substrate-binding protein [Oscillospiraceae bacterium]|nr:BMP family ABC transporter substrate-binding protein [Oscillospiraceae bacterium]